MVMKSEEKAKLGIYARPLYHPSAVRKWAVENGVEISRRGRLAVDIIKEYQEAKGTVLPFPRVNHRIVDLALALEARQGAAIVAPEGR